MAYSSSTPPASAAAERPVGRPTFGSTIKCSPVRASPFEVAETPERGAGEQLHGRTANDVVLCLDREAAGAGLLHPQAARAGGRRAHPEQ
jgi:hypothetical protein